MRPLVVKLGGSLLAGERLPHILQIVSAATGPLVVVPGGGPFADAVRTAQAEHHFDDATAHRMALLAMHQTAALLCGLAPRLVTADTLGEIDAAIGAGRIPVWQPLHLAGDAPDLPADWTVTSDGLAAWLAERLGNAPLVFVKSRTVPAGVVPEALARQGIVDPVFAERVRRSGLEWHIFGPGEEAALSALLAASSARRVCAASEPL